jgi:hypothetical protein
MVRSRRVLAVTLVLVAALSGCAGHTERYRQGLQWHLSTEAQKAELNRMGFPQYTDPY